MMKEVVIIIDISNIDIDDKDSKINNKVNHNLSNLNNPNDDMMLLIDNNHGNNHANERNNNIS